MRCNTFAVTAANSTADSIVRHRRQLMPILVSPPSRYFGAIRTIGDGTLAPDPSALYRLTGWLSRQSHT